MTDLEKDFDYKDEQFDYIQQSIRKFCLKCEFCLLAVLHCSWGKRLKLNTLIYNDSHKF